MSENGRVHPQCVNASNPYHECGVACLEKIAQGMGRKEKKKDSRNGIKQGELSKKMGGERRTNANCPKASNPYHECGEYCPNRTAETNPRRIEKESGSFGSSLSFGRKKKGSESRPNPPHLNNNYNSAVKAVYPADTISPRSPFSNGTKVESDNSQSFSSSRQHSEDSYSGHNSFTNGRVRSSESVRTPGSETQSDGPKSPSKVSLACFGIPSPTEQDEEDDEEEEEKLHDSQREVSGPLAKNMGGVISGQAVKSMNFTFSGISHATEASDEEDVRSVISDSCVSVGKYHVRANAASTLELIIEKYGDIAANCRLESASLRGFYLECLCSVVQELQSTPFEKLTKSKIKEMLAVLKDVESAQIDVTWLRGILNELTEAMDIKTTEAAKANCDNAIESTKKELETMLADLANKEKAVADAKEQIAETRKRLSELELEASRLSDAIMSIQPKIEKFHSKPLSEEIF